MRKLFIVGCPRSGTTLLQSILAGTASLHTLKETHFFKHLMRRRPLRWIDRHFGLDPGRVRHGFDFIARHNDLGLPERIDRIGTLAEACRAFDSLLGRAALDHGYSGWLEKTPEHMFFIDDIRRHIDGARFVHILRDGPDTIASLVDARRKYPQEWGWIGELSGTVRLYNRYVRALRRQIGQPDSFILRYEDLLARDVAAMQRLEAFLELEDGAIDLDDAKTYRSDIVRADEPWKQGRGQGIVDTKRQKFESLFAERQREFITRSILSTGDILTG